MYQAKFLGMFDYVLGQEIMFYCLCRQCHFVIISSQTYYPHLFNPIQGAHINSGQSG